MSLCSPSRFYLTISIIALVVMALQNFGSDSVYCFGQYRCDVSSVFLIFLVKILYVIFWTWVLSLMCDAGATPIAWLFVLLPFILFFLLIASLFLFR